MTNTVGLMLVIRNEISRIKECLEWHLPYVDELAICDQESDDGTWEYLQKLVPTLKIPCQIIQDKQWGYCEPSKQKTADLLVTDWILYLDPDEKFPLEFLKNIHQIIDTDKCDGFRFPRANLFKVFVFDENVPLEPKFIIGRHPAKDAQLRLTRRSVSRFPSELHHRVRIDDESGNRRVFDLGFEIEHLKTFGEQQADLIRYEQVNHK